MWLYEQLEDYISVVPKYIAVLPLLFARRVDHWVEGIFPNLFPPFEWMLALTLLALPIFLAALIIHLGRWAMKKN
jgi:hypothetical protein